MLEGRNLEADWVMGQITFLNQDFRYYMLYRVIINMNNLEMVMDRKQVTDMHRQRKVFGSLQFVNEPQNEASVRYLDYNYCSSYAVC